jgi:hypothetical protein
MHVEEYWQLTEALRERLAGEPDVLGLVALGSMSGDPPLPDDGSDHDFFVVTRPGAQERFRSRLDWLPNPDHVVLSFRETAHGVKALYRSAHLLEFAVFDPDELQVARVNRYRVLLDRADVTARMWAVREESARASAADRPDDGWLMGQLLTSLVVGAGRFRRGERLSAHQMVKVAALGHLVRLLARHVPAARPEGRDDLDPFRRFEAAWPGMGRELGEALLRELPEAASALLAVAVRELSGRLAAFPLEAASAVAAFLTKRP